MIRIEICNDFDIINDFLSKNFSSPTHWPEWNLVVEKFFNTNFYYLCAFYEDELIGICPVHEVNYYLLKNLYSGQYHYIPYGGWILSEKFKNFEIKHFKVKNFSFLQAFCLPEVPEFKFSLSFKKNYFKTLIIDLNKDLNTIWNNCIDSKRRNMIRKAEKNNLKINILKNYLSEDWYNLYYETSKLNNLKILPQDFFKDLFSYAQNISFLIINAEYNNEIISNAIIVYDKFYAIYWLGNNSKKYNLGQSELIQWNAIKQTKYFGCKYYDLCFIEKERLPKIYEFKKGFSKWEVEIPLLISKGIKYKFLNKLYNVFRIL